MIINWPFHRHKFTAWKLIERKRIFKGVMGITEFWEGINQRTCMISTCNFTQEKKAE